MAMATVLSRAQYGMDAPLVRVEVDLGNGLPAFAIVGLPEAVVKEIESKTPFKVVGTPDGADSVLGARLLNDRKIVTVENQNDDPRTVEIGMTAEVTWINRRRQPLCPTTNVPLPACFRIFVAASVTTIAARPACVSPKPRACVMRATPSRAAETWLELATVNATVRAAVKPVSIERS